MNNYDLSILIPARNEMFLSKTIENIIRNVQGKTEIIIVLDGAWANPGIPDYPNVTIIYNNTSIGQRAATNQACRLSKAKYVMKLDAHCELDKGFDVKMMAAMQDNYTMVPLMRNLHAFDWVCIGNTKATGLYSFNGFYTTNGGQMVEKLGCGFASYQGPTPEKCSACGGNMVRLLRWIAKESPKSTSFRFDKNLHFQYFNDFKKRPEGQGDLTETLSIQGSCFMLTRDRYWELNICDEDFGSWGQQGVEVACKTWLSGGKVVCNQTTWYAHMFRTQGGDFSFPYKQSQKQIDHAREYSKKLFFNNAWPLAKHPLSWLLKKFAPIPEWSEDDIKELEKKEMSQILSNSTLNDFRENKPMTKEIIFYTDNQLNLKIAHTVQKQLKKSGLPIISASLKPMTFGKNVHLPLQRGYLTMAKQILAALEATTADIVFFCEHDVLYHPSHFDFTPEKRNVYYYNTNVWRVRAADGFSLYVDDLRQLSGLCAYRETLIEHFRKRVQVMEEKSKQLDEKEFASFVRAMGFEPGTHGRPEKIDDLSCAEYKSSSPNIDIRHDANLTKSRWVKEAFRNKRYTQGWTESYEIPGWGEKRTYKDIFASI